ncbi:hypothetical protein I302_106167 [Kwoniella bestiolae CBS 10118]|uniref:Uncharacterized protein n=1 Tax=Kwoniella bestiolae CBS 10118 TaxID=1296100 RepID=A0A1B9G387_9TREE|nr:hypothetical protein I302_05290 [Kwoniella bestiolae CBS 10118]OCF25470.1 hypothetical protein I302_05290 [Kwoniella bestiolae CBS 10118]
MFYPPPSKRARQDSSTSTSTEHPQLTQLNHALTTLPPPQLTQILQIVLPHHPHALADFLTHHQAYLSSLEDARRKAPPKDFDHLSKSVWKELNITHRKLRPSQQFEVIGDIQEVIEDAIKTILRGCKDSPRVETKLSALETLRKIGKSMILCDEGEIRKGIIHYTPSVLADAMVEILHGMDEGEMDRLEETETPGGIRWLESQYGRYGVNVFGAVLYVLDGDDDEEEDGSDEEEDGSDEEGEED